MRENSLEEEDRSCQCHRDQSNTVQSRTGKVQNYTSAKMSNGLWAHLLILTSRPVHVLLGSNVPMLRSDISRLFT